MPANVPCPIDPVQVNVSHQRRNDAARWSAGDRPPDLPVAHHPGPQHRTQHSEVRLVTDALLQRAYQSLMRNRLESVGDVPLDQPPATPPARIYDHLQGVVRSASRAAPE